MEKKRTKCKFCSLEVTNFERHLERNHTDVKEVIELLTYPKKSKERKQIITLIRNSGNFDEFLRGTLRPIYTTKDKSSTSYYPCANCKGLYSKKFLSRHRKKCMAVNVNENLDKNRHQSASQTLIACAIEGNNTLHKLRVRKEVFDIMKADDISLVAKTDPLICQFGEQYLKKHRRKQMAVVCSNKMRQLARFLIELRRIKNDDKYTLCDAINPVMFDTVIECAKNIGGYDPNTKSYRAPSLSAHIGTSLKQVSNLLMLLLIKKDPIFKFVEDIEIKIQEIKRFNELIVSQWTTEISSLAFKGLNERNWDKPRVLPLTKDIIKFKTYVTEIANIALTTLKDNPNNIKQFKNLVDATLVLTILYNRKRIGDVHYTLLKTYLSNFSTINQDECLNSLSPSEILLTRHYKRVVTGGKR